MLRRSVVAALGLLAVACVGPARSYAVYESRATQSADEAESAVQTALGGIRDAVRNDAFSAYVSVVMKDAEESSSTALGHFSSIQPPDAASDRLRSELVALLQAADGAISRARIAARRGDPSALERLQRPLSQLASRLSAFLERHEP